MSHIVTKKIKAELQQFADRITPPEQNGVTPGKGLTAAELTERYGLTNDKAGNALKAGQIYVAKDLPAVNHMRRLIRAFEAGGWDQVEQYLLPFRTPEAVARQAAEAEAKATAEAAAQTVATEYATINHAFEAGAPSAEVLPVPACEKECTTCSIAPTCTSAAA